MAKEILTNCFISLAGVDVSNLFSSVTVNGTLETRDNVTHIIAGALYDYSASLKALHLKSRDFH